MTKTAFMQAYASYVGLYPWAQDADRLRGFLASCRATLNGANTWNHDGEACRAAWRAIGGKGMPTLKGLRAMPDGQEGGAK